MLNIGDDKRRNILKGFEDEIEKSRSGVYANTPENKKLNRVGQKYGAEKKDGNEVDSKKVKSAASSEQTIRARRVMDSDDSTPEQKAKAKEFLDNKKVELDENGKKKPITKTLEEHAATTDTETLKKVLESKDAKEELVSAAKKELEKRGVSMDKKSSMGMTKEEHAGHVKTFNEAIEKLSGVDTPEAKESAKSLTDQRNAHEKASYEFDEKPDSKDVEDKKSGFDFKGLANQLKEAQRIYDEGTKAGDIDYGARYAILRKVELAISKKIKQDDLVNMLGERPLWPDMFAPFVSKFDDEKIQRSLDFYKELSQEKAGYLDYYKYLTEAVEISKSKKGDK